MCAKSSNTQNEVMGVAMCVQSYYRYFFYCCTDNWIGYGNGHYARKNIVVMMVTIGAKCCLPLCSQFFFNKLEIMVASYRLRHKTSPTHFNGLGVLADICPSYQNVTNTILACTPAIFQAITAELHNNFGIFTELLTLNGGNRFKNLGRNGQKNKLIVGEKNPKYLSIQQGSLDFLIDAKISQ